MSDFHMHRLRSRFGREPNPYVSVLRIYFTPIELIVNYLNASVGLGIVTAMLLAGLMRMFAQEPVFPIAIVDVRVVDVTGKPSRSGMTVITQGDKITAVGRTRVVAIPKNAQIIDGKGKFLIPGLWDMHTHAVSTGGRTQRFWKLFVAYGITGTREMGNDHKSLEFGRALAKRPDVLSPRIIWSSPMLDGDLPTFDSGIAVKTRGDARRIVREMKSSGYDLLKIYNGLSREAFFGIADEARRRKIPIAGEVPDSVSPIEASRSGMRSLEHLWNLFEFCVPHAYSYRDRLKDLERREASREEKRTVRDKQDATWIAGYDRKCSGRMVAEFKRNKTWLVPTLAINRNYAFMDDAPDRDDLRRRTVPGKHLERWDQLREETLAEYGDKTALAWRSRYGGETDILRQAYAVGVGVLAGSDATDWEPFIFAGASLHEELRLLVEAGLTPLAALQAATIEPARFLGIENEFGTVSRGKSADLVLLDADPLKDITNTAKISAVILRGRHFSEKHLARLRKEAERLAENDDKQE